MSFCNRPVIKLVTIMLLLHYKKCCLPPPATAVVDVVALRVGFEVDTVVSVDLVELVGSPVASDIVLVAFGSIALDGLDGIGDVFEVDTVDSVAPVEFIAIDNVVDGVEVDLVGSVGFGFL